MTGRSGEGNGWDRVEDLCYSAMQLSGDARRLFLDEHCGGDADLRTTIETLLDASESHPGFLDEPIVTLDELPMRDTASPTVTRIGRYRIVRLLGRGGMGDVYLATAEGEDFSHPVALKVIRRGFDTERVLERFRQERRILAGLRHQNIAGLIDGGATEDGRPYFVMEFVDGESIDDFCQRRQLGIQDRLRLVGAVCGAVHFAHRNLVLHRDIKPANILVTADGVPKLLDFGIGRVMVDDSEDAPGSPVTVLEERALTPEYAAPEQLAGEPVTTATDVFGLGVLLYQLVTGDLPWSTEAGVRATAASRRDEGVVRPSKTEGGQSVPADVDAIILKALAESPADRYTGPLALAEDIERYLKGEPIRAKSPTLAYTAKKFVGRHRAGVAAVFAVATGLSVGMAYTLRQSARVAVERDRALEVRGFLLETFGAAGPDRETGDPVTARALLDGQAATVLDQYGDDPSLQAEMMIVLAEGYERLGLFSEAETWAHRVVESGSAIDQASLASAETLLGWVLHQQGRSQPAEEILTGAVARARDAGGGGRTLARALNDLGVVREALGDYDDALGAHEEARTMRISLFGATHRSVAVSSSNISAVHYRLGDLDAAVSEAEGALALMRATFGSDHQRAIIVQHNLAVFKLVDGDLAGAEADYRELLTRQARLQGREHPVTVRVMISLAAVLRRAEEWREAEEVLREVMEIEERRTEPNPIDIGYAMAVLGDVVSTQGGRHDEAIQLIDGALRHQTQALGPYHVDVAQSQGYLSRAFERVDSLQNAVRWQETVVGTLHEALGADHAQTLAEEERLADLQERAGIR